MHKQVFGILLTTPWTAITAYLFFVVLASPLDFLLHVLVLSLWGSFLLGWLLLLGGINLD